MSGLQQFSLTFEGVDSAEANRLIQSLQDDLEAIDPSLETSRLRPDSQSQDFGTTLILVFGTPVAIALANGIASFLKRNSGARLSIDKDGNIIAENLNSEDAPKIAAALSRKS